MSIQVPSPEDADTHVRAHLEALGVPEVRKERLHEVSILCRDDDDIRLSANLRK